MNPQEERVEEVLSEDEEEVLELEEVTAPQEAQDRWCLLARVLGSKHVNPQAFSTLMGKVWNPKKGIEVEQLGRNLFFFSLFSRRDRQEVLTLFDEKGEKGWGKFVRVRVNMGVDKPIRKSLMIRTGKGDKVEILYRYEGLPNFCYLCGRLDHQLKDYDRRTEDSDEEEQVNYGEWLRASPRKPFRLKVEGRTREPDGTKPDKVNPVKRQLQLEKADELVIGSCVKENLTNTLQQMLVLGGSATSTVETSPILSTTPPVQPSNGTGDKVPLERAEDVRPPNISEQTL
ncbi:hypothetical protein Tsubulata_035017 [Turnera subulata]|uniref:Zinc knuckle CX2CX4HX4C domain-containing protein n=1 Tax=Turnera subulata TaxID=218843 RepID=A0A9Q0J2D9_9ROSI|nr:hypothetical protein Tsubulata_035017 [Turnera subulata]